MLVDIHELQKLLPVLCERREPRWRRIRTG
jgi:hypothetical protein